MKPIEHIRKVRLRVSQAELAAIAGVDQSTVSRWEEGLSSPRLEDIIPIRSYAIEKGLRWDDRWLFEDVVSWTEFVAGFPTSDEIPGVRPDPRADRAIRAARKRSAK